MCKKNEIKSNWHIVAHIMENSVPASYVYL